MKEKKINGRVKETIKRITRKRKKIKLRQKI